MEPEMLYSLLGGTLREKMQRAFPDMDHLLEIRLRVNRPVLLQYDGQEMVLRPDGTLGTSAQEGYLVSAEELRETMECISGYSMYAFDEELKQGFLTVPGGHRIGVAGKIVMEHGKIQGIRHISCVNIRLSHQMPGCADLVVPYVMENAYPCHTLIISPPCCGKTTLLRDLIRQLSNGSTCGKGVTVGVVDERSELAGSYFGIPQNDLGMRTDILDCCAKAEGMLLLLRSMSPQVIAVDEIGSSADWEALEHVFHCGCKLLATVHGTSIEDIQKKPLLHRMIQMHMFERYIVLGGKRAGHVKEIFDGRGTVLYRSGGEAAVCMQR